MAAITTEALNKRLTDLQQQVVDLQAQRVELAAKVIVVGSQAEEVERWLKVINGD